MTSCRRSIAPSTFYNWPGSVARSYRGIFVRVSNGMRAAAKLVLIKPHSSHTHRLPPPRPNFLFFQVPFPRGIRERADESPAVALVGIAPGPGQGVFFFESPPQEPRH